jgi:glycosyltransferase involved in cell wall biosynthesis
MRIAVNARLLIPNPDGIGWFAYESLKRIVTSHPEHEFIFIFDRKYDRKYIFSKNVIPVVIPPPTRHPYLINFWLEYSLPFVLKKYKADLFVSPDGWLSLRTKVPSVAVIHDLNFEKYPEYLPDIYRKFYQKLYPRYARKAIRIATVSEFSKNDLIKRYHLSPEKIDVVYNGCNTEYKPVSESEQKKVLTDYHINSPYFIFVSSLHPRKNLVNLFKAFDLFKSRKPSDIKLFIVGKKMWWTSEMESAYQTMHFRDDVVFAGRLGTSDLNRVIGSALAMVYVSFFEGFGIPLVEAFNCGTPVITSNITSMPEIAGDAAIYADPFSVDSIAEAMNTVASDKQLRENLIQKGNERKLLYSWDKTAELLWNCIEKAMPQEFGAKN